MAILRPILQIQMRVANLKNFLIIAITLRIEMEFCPFKILIKNTLTYSHYIYHMIYIRTYVEVKIVFEANKTLRDYFHLFSHILPSNLKW